MPKGTFKKMVGIVACLFAFFVVFDHSIYAFDFFGLLKPRKQEVYQAGGSFQPDAYISRLKEDPHRNAMNMRGSLVRIDCVPLNINRISITVSEEGDVTGAGEIGRVACTWYKADEDGTFKAVYMDWKFQFTFSGQARGDNLEGKVRQVVYSWEKKTGDNQMSWSAKKKGEIVSGKILNIKGGDLPFTATVGQVVEVEMSPVPEPSLELSPSPSPQPSEKKKLKLIDFEGKKLTNGKAVVQLTDGTREEVEVKNGEIVYDSGLIKKITVKDLDNPDKKLTLQPGDLENGEVVIGTEKEWLEQIMPQLEKLAKILNEGREIDINKYFEIDPNADEAEHKPPLLDFLRKFGVKDKISFNAEQMAWTGDINTVVHEILGHAFTEVIGEGNKITYGGVGVHDDPWQPAFKERSILNPARWFGGKEAALSEDKAKGMALSEGWAQYVGDKWDRELRNIADEESELTTANAQKEIANRKGETYGKLYDEKGYGAKVENVVATVFNEIYKGKGLEEAVVDFVAVRKEFKRIHNGKSFQTISQFIYQKIQMIEDGPEEQRIKDLIKDLVLE